MKEVIFMALCLLTVVTIITSLIGTIRDIRLAKTRRKLLDEVVDYLHEQVAVCGRNLTSHEEFMIKFCKRFGSDRF